MKKNRLRIAVITAILIPMTIGCEEDERLVKMAEKHLERQTDQNRRMSQLQKQVAEGARRLVQADAESRHEMVALQREIQAERAEVGRQRDTLEKERRDLAAKRYLDPVIAAAITNVGLLLACLLPLVLCCYLLHRRVEPADDAAIAEVLLDDLISDKPLLLPRLDDRRAIGFDRDDDPSRSSDESDCSAKSV